MELERGRTLDPSVGIAAGPGSTRTLCSKPEPRADQGKDHAVASRPRYAQDQAKQAILRRSRQQLIDQGVTVTKRVQRPVGQYLSGQPARGAQLHPAKIAGAPDLPVVCRKKSPTHEGRRSGAFARSVKEDENAAERGPD